MKEYSLHPTVLEMYQNNLKLIEARIELFISDPSQTPPDLIRNWVQVQMIIEKESTDLTNEEHLKLLDRLEKWYTDKGLLFPNNEYLERQRKDRMQDF